jgi:hypothetical protein
MIAVVALALVAAVTTTVTWQCMTCRRVLHRRQRELQAAALARAGVELAADRLLRDPEGYRGESVELIPEGRVRVEVRADPRRADLFRVASAARYPGEGKDTALRTAARTFRRTSRDGRVRLEVVAEKAEVTEQ